MKRLFITMLCVMLFGVAAQAEDTLKLEQKIVNLEKRIEQLESKALILQARLDSMVVVLDEPLPAKDAQTNGKENAKETQCKAVTKKGTRCTRIATDGGYCWQHKR